jgi:hypothetical protein
MAFEKFKEFLRWFYYADEPKPSREIAELKAQMAHFEDLLLARKQTLASEKTNEVSELRGIIENLEANLASQKKTYEAKIEVLVESLNSQKQTLEEEKQVELFELQLSHEHRIDSIVAQYEGPKPKPNGCGCHDRSCCVAGRCSRPVRYRAADGQSFCGMCFMKRKSKKFVDLSPSREKSYRKTAAIIPLSDMETKDSLHE